MTKDNLTEAIGKPEETPANHAHGRAGSLRRWLTALVMLGIVAGVLAYGIRSRIKAEAALRTVTQQMAIPSVSVVFPKREAPSQEIILPGSIQPFISSPIYARTNGYLKKMVL